MAPKSCFSRSGPPLEPYRARTLFLETPPELPKACFGRPGGARNPPKRARSLQGPDQIHKVSMLKTLEICVFGPQGSQKNSLGSFFDAPNSHPGPSRVAPLILKVASGPPKSSPGPPGTPPGAPQDPPGTP